MPYSKRRIADPDLEAHIGANLRRHRVRLGWSQQVLGEKLGITFQQVQKYENGTNRISASTLYRLSTIMNVPVMDFFAGLDIGSGKAAPALTRDEAQLLRLYAQIPDEDCRRSIRNMLRSFCAYEIHSHDAP